VYLGLYDIEMEAAQFVCTEDSTSLHFCYVTRSFRLAVGPWPLAFEVMFDALDCFLCPFSSDLFFFTNFLATITIHGLHCHLFSFLLCVVFIMFIFLKSLENPQQRVGYFIMFFYNNVGILNLIIYLLFYMESTSKLVLKIPQHRVRLSNS
jgi:ABC-type transport system involved in cytochrome c biogenesis permease subunit